MDGAYAGPVLAIGQAGKRAAAQVAGSESIEKLQDLIRRAATAATLKEVGV